MTLHHIPVPIRLQRPVAEGYTRYSVDGPDLGAAWAMAGQILLRLARDTRFYEPSDADRLAVALRYAVEALDKVLRTYPSSAEWVESSAHLIADALRGQS